MSKQKENLSLNDLNIIKHTEIKLNDDFILPVKIDISKVCYDEVNIATFNMLKLYDKKRYDKITKDSSQVKLNVNKIELKDNNLYFDISDLTYDKELNQVRIEHLLKSYLKHINIEDKLFEGKNLLEFLECENIYDYLIENELSNREFVIIQNNICFWIDYVSKEINKKVNTLLELDDEKGTYYNQAMIELQIAYEYGKGIYFQENINKACNEWSYREKLLSKAYFTKKYLIDKAANDEIKNSMKSSKTKKTGV